jgi:regulator of CtrA degradation
MGSAVAVYFRRTYDEAFDLTVEARDYFAGSGQADSRRLEDREKLIASCESMRITSRLIQVMAWLMMQRALYEGEIDFEEACAEYNRLSGGGVCLDNHSEMDETLPSRLRSLLARSYRLYLRIDRLDQQQSRNSSCLG